MNETLAAVSSLSAISFMARAWLSAELINSATVMPMSCTAGNEMTGRAFFLSAAMMSAAHVFMFMFDLLT